MLSKKRVIELVVVLVFLMDLVCGFYEEKEQTKYTTAKLNITICYSERKRCAYIHQNGLFGSHSPIKKASGWLYKLSDSNVNGCKIFQVNVDKPWIALVQRGSCRFDVKIRNAFKHNATAIIIYDTKESNMPKMLNLGSSSIVSVSITKTDGDVLLDMMDMNNETSVFVQINVGLPHTKWQVNPTSVLFVSVSFIVLMVISLAWLVFYYVQRFRYVHARDKTEKRLTSAAKKAIAKLSTRTVSKKHSGTPEYFVPVRDKKMSAVPTTSQKNDEEEEVDSCPVCLDGYKGGETLRILPCQHEFHKMCIDPWLIEHRTCPMCKLNILKELEVPNTDVGRSSVEVEAATVEPPQENEDHQNAADNPVVFIGEIEDSPVVLSRRQSVDGESSGSSDSSARILHVNADINWERDEQTSSTSNLMDSSSLRT